MASRASPVWKQFLVVLFLVATLSLTPSFAQTQPSPGLAPDLAGWTVVDGPSNTSLYALDMVSPTDGWAAGSSGFMWRYNGTAWVGVATSFDDAILALDMVDSTAGWAVSYEGRVLRWNGSSWAPQQALAGSPINDVCMLSTTNGWAVNALGKIFRYNGTTWTEVASPTTQKLMAIDMLNANDGWAVGDAGTVLHWNGAVWQPGAVGAGVWFWGVDAVGPTDVWAVGSGGAIYHYNGAWSQVASPTTETLRAIQMTSSTSGWAVGYNGTILYYNGQSWSLASSPTTQSLHALSMTGSSDGWAVGKFGVLLHYTGRPADLSASIKRVNRVHASPGETLTYTIEVRNTGDLPASAVSVTDATPAGATYVNGSATISRGTIQGTNPLRVALGDLEAGGLATITLQATVNSSSQTCWFVTNQAVIQSGAGQLTRWATTTMGDCYTSYLPAIGRMVR